MKQGPVSLSIFYLSVLAILLLASFAAVTEVRYIEHNSLQPVILEQPGSGMTLDPVDMMTADREGTDI